MNATIQTAQDKALAAIRSTRADSNDLVLVVLKSEARVDSRVMAARLGSSKRHVMALINKYLAKFQEFGHVSFKNSCGNRKQGGGTQERYALLNEDQSYFLLSLSRNSERVVDLKVRLVMAFRDARRAVDINKTEYLPEYHHLHDVAHALAKGSDHERFMHMNLNKLVNKTVGLMANQRGIVSASTQALLAIVQTIAANAMRGATDHHVGYERAKQALESFSTSMKREVCNA